MSTVYEAPAELPDTAVIGRFRRDKLADTIDNGVRTARMELHKNIPSTVNLAGEFFASGTRISRKCVEIVRPKTTWSKIVFRLH